MDKEFEDCPICGERNWLDLSEVGEGKEYQKGYCSHRLWDPLMGSDFLRGFLKHSQNTPAIKDPQFHALNLDAIPDEVLEANRGKLEKILRDNLREVNGWWFGKVEEIAAACRELAVILKPISDHYSR
jgi:hypothetical protein